MNSTTTKNGMGAYESTLNKCVDLFYNIGASRGKDIIPTFESAVDENKDTAIRIAQWARDIRGGCGERKLYRDILCYLAKKDTQTCTKLVQKTVEIGRFDDLLVLFGTPVERDVLRLISTELNKKNGLCAKWLPRQGKDANKIRAYLQLTPKNYRQLLSELSKTVEQKMCAKKWDEIEFSKVPSVASARYQKAFSKNAGEAYGEYIKKLEKGEEKINASAVYPYDIIKSVRCGSSHVANEQWKALPNYLDNTTERIIPVVDVSGSMTVSAGKNKSVTCLDVAVSLGLYICERNMGVFKDQFITFSTTPVFEKVGGTLSDRLRQMEASHWSMSTNIEAVFDTILKTARLYSVPEEHMPTKILILSDMQFDSCAKNPSDTAMQMISKKYEDAGYKLPQIVFWNLNASGNAPTTFSKSGVALVSGFSPAIMKNILACKNLNPEQMMLDTVMCERYNF